MPSVFSAALGKELVRRVPEGIHSANIKTLGKFEDSGSDRTQRDNKKKLSAFSTEMMMAQLSFFWGTFGMISRS